MPAGSDFEKARPQLNDESFFRMAIGKIRNLDDLSFAHSFAPFLSKGSQLPAMIRELHMIIRALS